METTEASNETTIPTEEIPISTEDTREETQEVSEESDPEIEQDSEEDTEASTEGGESEEEEDNTSPEENLHTIVVNGEKQQLSTEQLIRAAQKGAGADIKFEEAAEARRTVAKMYERLKDDPFEVIKEIGKDPEQLATDLLYEKYRKEQMSPEEKEKEELKQKLTRYEQKDIADRKVFDDQQREVEIQGHLKSIDEEISNAFETSSLARTDLNLKNIARYMAEGEERFEAGDTEARITAKEAAIMVEMAEMDAMGQRLSGDGEQIFNTIGEKAFKEANKYYLKKIKSGTDGSTDKFEAVNNGRGNKAPKKQNWNDLMKEIKGMT